MGELNQENLSPLLKLKYGDSIPDAISKLGPAENVTEMFKGFQRYLYLTDGG